MSVCPPEHRHGEVGTCYKRHGCRCVPCSKRHKGYMAWYNDMKAVNGTTALTPIDGRGTRRRIQALIALGWPVKWLAIEAGLYESRIRQMLEQDGVSRQNAQKVSDLYERLSMRAPVARSVAEQRVITRAKSRAIEAGWVVPLAWDDIDRDEAPVQAESVDIGYDHAKVEQVVAGASLPLTFDERVEVVRRLTAKGWMPMQIARHLGVPRATIQWDVNRSRQRAAQRKAA